MTKKSNKIAMENKNNTLENEKNTPVTGDNIDNITESEGAVETEKTEPTEDKPEEKTKEASVEQTEQTKTEVTETTEKSEETVEIDTDNKSKNDSKSEESTDTLNSAIQKLTSNTDTTTVVDNKEDSTEAVTGISTYEDPNRVISDADEIAEAQSLMNNYIDGITSGSTYSQVMTGEDQYVYYMYNSKGEIFTQDVNATYTEVFLNDNKVFKYDTDAQTLSIGNDIDIASILRNAVSAIGNDNVTLYEMDLADVDAPEGHEYRIDLVGDDAIKLLYNSVSEDFATDMLASITESISDWEPHIIMVLFIGDKAEDSYGYCLYVIDDTEYTNWFFQGYDTVDDWALDDAWYDYNAESDTEGKTYTNLMNSLVEKVNTIMTSYADSKGWLSDTIDNQESTETESVEGTESTESTETESVESTEEVNDNN